MNNLKSSFDDVADWCETHLEDQYGPEVGMTFGTLLRCFGRMAASSSGREDSQRGGAHRQQDAKAEKLLWQFSTRFLVAFGPTNSKTIMEPTSMRTNMTYDPAPHSAN
jgi:hypothetical protein